MKLATDQSVVTGRRTPCHAPNAVGAPPIKERAPWVCWAPGTKASPTNEACCGLRAGRTWVGCVIGAMTGGGGGGTNGGGDGVLPNIKFFPYYW